MKTANSSRASATALVARLVPAVFFTALLVLRWYPIERALHDIALAVSATAALQSGLQLAYNLLAALFYLLVAVLFLRRLPATTLASGPWPLALAVAGTWSAAPLVFLTPTENGLATALVATALMVAGIAGSCVTLGTLGRSFGVRPGARELVTGGPYRFVRHPLYVFEALTQLGVLLVVLSPFAVALFALHLCLQGWRALLEERVLSGAFPAYRTYQASTSRFVPGLI
jgi:protein-S-isoprenylcysteine O-methyltransferase Ste14